MQFSYAHSGKDKATMKHNMGTKLGRRARFRSLLVLGLLVGNTSAQALDTFPEQTHSLSQQDNTSSQRARTLVQWLGIRQRNSFTGRLVELPAPIPDMKLVPQVPMNLPAEIRTVSYEEETTGIDPAKALPICPETESNGRSSSSSPPATVTKSTSGTPTIIRMVVPTAVGPEDASVPSHESLLDLELPGRVIESAFSGRKVIEQETSDLLSSLTLTSRVSVAPALKFTDADEETADALNRKSDSKSDSKSETELTYEPLTEEPFASHENASSEATGNKPEFGVVVNSRSNLMPRDSAAPTVAVTESPLQRSQIPASEKHVATSGQASIVGSTSKNSISMRVSSAEPTLVVPLESTQSDQPRLKPTLSVAKPVSSTRNVAQSNKNRSIVPSNGPGESSPLVRAVQPAVGMKTVSEIESVIAQYEESSSPQAGAGQIRELNKSIKKNFPGSRIEIKTNDDGLVVVGVAASEKEAEKILSVVRKATLAPVLDRVTTKRVSKSTFDE